MAFMASVSFRPIDRSNFKECGSLKVAPSQGAMVPHIYKSIAEAYANPSCCPYAVYDASQRGWGAPQQPVIGFAMTQVEAGLGFISSLYIDIRFQRKGYGEATAKEMIRRLKLSPDVELIVTSHHEKNTAVKALFAKLGFVPWEIAWAKNVKEVDYLQLPDGIANID